MAGAVIHHAGSQTAAAAPAAAAPPQRSCETQTLRTATGRTQTSRDKAVQMARRGIVLDTSRDRTLVLGAAQPEAVKGLWNGDRIRTEEPRWREPVWLGKSPANA